MPRALYYASTSRVYKDAVHYGTIAALRGWFYAKYPHSPLKADALAALTTTPFFAGFTTEWYYKESEMFMSNARDAVSAELGIPAAELKFSDLWDSKNEIVKRERHDLLKLNSIRYLVDAMVLIPTAIWYFAGHGPEWAKNILPDEKTYKKKNADDLSSLEDGRNNANGGGIKSLIHTAMGYMGLMELIFAGKAGYWWYETYKIPKTGHYEVIKLNENVTSTMGDAGFNDIFRIYQRTRDDRDLLPINEQEKAAVTPLIQLMVDKYNKSSRHSELPKFGISELMYLMGSPKVKIHNDKGEIDQAVIDQSKAAIEEVATIGLDGIRERNRQHRVKEGKNPQRGFVERLGHSLLDASYKFSGLLNFSGKHENARTISDRDPYFGR